MFYDISQKWREYGALTLQKCSLLKLWVYIFALKTEFKQYISLCFPKLCK